jgi:hypothetical protein
LTCVANYCAAIQVHLLCCEVWGIGQILHGYVFQWRDVRVQSFVWSHQWPGWLRWLVILCGCSTVERLSFEEFFNHSFMESLRWVFHLCASVEGTESSAQHAHFFLWMSGTNRELAVTKSCWQFDFFLQAQVSDRPWFAANKQQLCSYCWSKWELPGGLLSISAGWW